jgi:rfaE bifunctional protein kinase chain/domain
VKKATSPVRQPGRGAVSAKTAARVRHDDDTASFRPWRDRVASARVLVVGDVMLDRYWFGEVERISPEAPVPVVRIAREEERPGGAANVARNVAALGAHAALLSVTGDDEAGRALSRLLARERVDASFLRDATLRTTVKLRVIGRQQQLLRIDFETAPSGEVLASKLADFERLLGAADLVILSDYGKGGLAHIATMIERARTAGKPVLVDPKGDEWDKYRGASLLTPNRNEFRQVVGRWRDEADMTARAHALRERLDLGALLVTRSEEGMSLYAPGQTLTIPAQAREVYDVSGAGDTVIATLGTLLAGGASMPAAMRIANAAAGVVVAKLGTAVVDPDELP